jgi:hypothetical protein
LIQTNKNDKHLDGVVGDADALGPGVFGVGLGAATETNEIGNDVFSQELEKQKIKPFKSLFRWLKESY